MAVQDVFQVTFEAPGVQTTQFFNILGVQTFNGLGTSTNPNNSGQLIAPFTTNFGSGLSVGYTNLFTVPAGNNGGAGGTGRYARVAPSSTTTIDITNTSKSGPGINYFGMWISAFDPGNFVEFKRGGTTVYTFGPADVLAALGSCANAQAQAGNAYCGNPNTQFLDAVANEPFAFVNFVNLSGKFDQIVLRQSSPINQTAGYQTDNHSFAVVPEPASWLLLIGGFGLVGSAMRRSRRPALA